MGKRQRRDAGARAKPAEISRPEVCMERGRVAERAGHCRGCRVAEALKSRMKWGKELEKGLGRRRKLRHAGSLNPSRAPRPLRPTAGRIGVSPPPRVSLRLSRPLRPEPAGNAPDRARCTGTRAGRAGSERNTAPPLRTSPPGTPPTRAVGTGAAIQYASLSALPPPVLLAPGNAPSSTRDFGRGSGQNGITHLPCPPRRVFREASLRKRRAGSASRLGGAGPYVALKAHPRLDQLHHRAQRGPYIFPARCNKVLM